MAPTGTIDQTHRGHSPTALTRLTVEGDWPQWLRGKLVRNGPALFEAGSQDLRHWFDGFGMLHGFTIDGDTVYYQSKFIRSPEYLHDRETGRVSAVTWGAASDPCRSIFRRLFANFTAAATNTPVAVTKIADRYYSTSDIATLNEFDIAELDTLSTVTTAKRATMAAHPAYIGGEVWNRIGRAGLSCVTTSSRSRRQCHAPDTRSPARGWTTSTASDSPTGTS